MKIALMGMGAIGTVYGKLLYEKYGDQFAVIAGESRAEKLKMRGVTLNHHTFHPRVLSKNEGNGKFDLIIVCVKNYQLEEAMEDLRPFLGEETILLPLLNGVTARDRLLKAFPENRIFYGLCVFIDAERLPEGVVNTTDGLIQFGYEDNTRPKREVTDVKNILEDAGIKAQVCPDMKRAVWRKWMLNVGLNQVSAVTGAPYGKMTGIASNHILFHEAMMEVVALAKAAGVNIAERDALEFEKSMDGFSPNGKTSMLQDVEAKRQTEVDYFAGTVIELGEKYDVPTPVNHVLYYLIKSIEQLYIKG